MRICDCVAIYTHRISHSFDMSKRCVCHAYASYTQYQFRMVEKVAQPVSLHAIHSRFTATEQVLGIVITIHSLLLLLPLVLFCYCYFSTSTHTHAVYCYRTHFSMGLVVRADTMAYPYKRKPPLASERTRTNTTTCLPH